MEYKSLEPESSDQDLRRKIIKEEKRAAKAAKAAKAIAKQTLDNNKPSSKPKKEIRLKKEFLPTTQHGEKKDLSSYPLDSQSMYDPSTVEASWYAWWEKEGFFSPDCPLIGLPSGHHQSEDSKKPFVIVIPPPNVTGSLHLGHALTNCIQDAICRFHRMNGRPVLWVPGVDHAGIATQSIVEKHLWKDQNLTRKEIGRGAFVEHVWNWKNKYGHRIVQQLRRLGSSLDWSRERFTMDNLCSNAVSEAFISLFRKGIIVRGTRLVNWSCKLQTAISDIEVDTFELTQVTKLAVPNHNPQKRYTFGALWYFAYQLMEEEADLVQAANSATLDHEPVELIVATTRPETMLGDTALAVHPSDQRYSHLVGRFVKHPFIPERRIKIVADDQLVDMSFGSGVVKITPAHDPNDYACGMRHNLEFINILNLEGSINEKGGQFQGMMRYDAREAVVSELDKLGLLREIKPNPMVLRRCSRSSDIIEPLLLPQWWVRSSILAKPALDAVLEGRLQIIPEQHKNVWRAWLTESQDWCISRQLWWGHRIPAWYVTLSDQSPLDTTVNSSWMVAHNEEEALKMAEERWPGQVQSISQDPDVLDTWFSSALFPFSVFGWPTAKTSDLSRFYPTSLLETGHDILFFWVARMVMMGLELTGQLPFQEILLHAMIRDAHGRKMSKSLGNVIDPIDVIEGIDQQGLIDRLYSGNLEQKEITRATQSIQQDFPNGIGECGTDALRFALCSYTAQARDINLDIARVQAYRNFCNKIWNATKLAMMLLGKLSQRKPSENALDMDNQSKSGYHEFQPRGEFTEESFPSSPFDRWILSRLNATIIDCRENFKVYDFSNITNAIYKFWLYDLCDVYLEICKPIGFSTTPDPQLLESMRQTIYTCIEEGLRLLHPFMPFITEELWQQIPRRSGFLKIPSICLAPYPEEHCEREQPDIERAVGSVQDIIHAVRSMRVEYNIPRKYSPALIIKVYSKEYDEMYSEYIQAIKILSYCSCVQVRCPESTESIPVCAVSIPNETCELHLDIKSQVDVEKEIARLNSRVTSLGELREPLLKRINAFEYEKVPDKIKETESKKLKGIEQELQLLSIAKSKFEKLCTN